MKIETEFRKGDRNGGRRSEGSNRGRKKVRKQRGGGKTETNGGGKIAEGRRKIEGAP